SAVIRKQLEWVVEAPHRIFADAFEIEIAFDEVGERAGQQHRSPQLFGEGLETRSHVDRRTDDGEVEPGARPDIAVHDVSDVDADAVIQRRTTGFAVLFVQGNHGLTGFGHGMQQICAGRRLAERKNGEQTVADKFQYFPAVSRNRLRHRVEIAVQKINDVITRPVVGDPGKITQIADHDGGAYRRPASAPGGAGQDELAGMRPDIGFEQRSRQPVLDADFADQRQSRQQFQQAGDMRVVETPGRSVRARRSEGNSYGQETPRERRDQGPLLRWAWRSSPSMRSQERLNSSTPTTKPTAASDSPAPAR